MRRITVVLVLCLAVGCALRARQHPCWAYLRRAYGGAVPDALVQRLAGERGAERQIARQRAPVGYYWRRVGERPLDLFDIRTMADGHELAPCPGVPSRQAP